jgi:hypothetical protein
VRFGAHGQQPLQNAEVKTTSVLHLTQEDGLRQKKNSSRKLGPFREQNAERTTPLTVIGAISGIIGAMVHQNKTEQIPLLQT